MRRYGKKVSTSISVMRVIAMIYVAIILHYLPHYLSGNVYLNLLGEFFSFAGVPTFFMISGYLFGYKDRGKTKKDFSIQFNLQWLKKRILRIIIAYEIIVFTVLLVQIVMGEEVSLINTAFQIFNLQGIVQLKYAYAELGHTWFLSIIMVCYLITPGLRILESKRGRHAVASIFCGVIVALSFLPVITSASYTGSVFLYCLMYFIGRDGEKMECKKIPIKGASLLGLSLLCRVAGWYLWDETFVYYSIVVFSGMTAAISYFQISCWLWEKIQKVRLWSYCEGLVVYLSRISYEFYLVHALFLSGVTSLVNIFGGGVLEKWCY